MIGPGSSKKRTKYTPSVVVLALIFPSHHKLSSPLYQKWAPLGTTVALQRLSHSARRFLEPEPDAQQGATIRHDASQPPVGPGLGGLLSAKSFPFPHHFTREGGL